MSPRHDELVALEKQFWTGDEKFFRAHVDDQCLVAFTEMSGVMDNPDIAATARKGNRWKDLEIELKGIIEPSADVVLLSYEARATRSSGEAYAAIVSTGYVNRADGWKMMFHAQAPIGGAGDGHGRQL